MSMHEGYAETAYRADAIPEQSHAPKNEMLRGRILETRLPWGSYVGVNPTTYQYSELWFKEYQYIGKEYHDYTMINELRWSQHVDEDINDFYRIVRFVFVIFSNLFSFSGGAGWFVFGVVAICTILFVFAADTLIQAFAPLIFVSVACGIATIFRHFWEEHEIKFYKGNRNWSNDYAFCRRSGMVKTDIGAFPFYEFDAYIEMTVGTQGSQFHSLNLIHRYPHRSRLPHTKHPLEFSFTVDGSIAQLYAAWDMLQRYMDVSQPLPDVPGLEIHRHKDPTTAAADQQQGRNPRYWRDMDEASVKQIQEEKYRKNIRLR